MVDGDGGIDIEMQPRSWSGAAPQPTPTSVRGHVPPGYRAGERRRSADRPVATAWSSTRRRRTRAPDRRTVARRRRCSPPVGHCRGQIREHRARVMGPWASIGVGHRGRDLRRQPGQIRQLPHKPIPACDTTPWPSADTFTRPTAAVPSPGKCLPARNHGNSEVPLPRAGQALSSTQHRVKRSFTKTRG